MGILDHVNRVRVRDHVGLLGVRGHHIRHLSPLGHLSIFRFFKHDEFPLYAGFIGGICFVTMLIVSEFVTMSVFSELVEVSNMSIFLGTFSVFF